MPDPVGTVNVVDPVTRKSHAVTQDQLAGALASGFKIETPDDAAVRVSDIADEETYGGIGGKVVTLGANILSGATVGLSDLGIDALGGGDTLNKLNQTNKYTAITGQILGGVGGAVVPGLGWTPAGKLSALGNKVANVGKGAGVAKATGTAVLGGAIEGAGQSAGQYLGSAALENKPLSAEGFLGALGSGALLGGAFSGGLALGEAGLVKAKTLFPRSEVTREAAQEAERAVSTELASAAADGDDLLRNAKAELQKNRLIISASDADTAQKVNALKVQRAEEALAREQLKTQQAAQRATTAGKRTRKTFEEPTAPTPDAPAPAPVAVEGDDLLAKLQGTKQQLDDGVPLNQVGKRSLDDEIDDVVAARDPNHAKLLDATRELDEAKSAMDRWLAKYNKGGKYDSGEVAAFERAQASRDYASGMRKSEGYVDTVPVGEGNVALPRGRQQVWRGSEEARAAADARTMAKLTPEERVAADLAAEGTVGRWRGKGVGEEILSESVEQAAPMPVDQAITKALRSHVGEHADATEDILEAAQVIGRYEEAAANVAEVLGPMAPPSATARAVGLRDAATKQLDGGATSVAEMAKEMEKRIPADVAPTLTPANPSNVGAAAAADGSGALKKAADIGTVLEVMSSLGLPGVPDLKSLPVIGPILSLYLKARAASAVYRRLGGKVPANAETTIAKHAAKTRDRVEQAVDKMLDLGAKGARKAREASGPMAALATKLFNAPGEKAERKPTKKTDPYRDYEKRIAELATASQPGAVAEAVRKAVPTADPHLQAELVAAAERKMSFLNDKAPKPMKLPTLLKGDGDWKPSKLQLQQFSRYIEAANDPAGVLERLNDTGQVTYEAAETLRVVYPALYRAAQMRLMEKAPQLTERLPYPRRVALSILFQVPVDGTMDSDYVNFLRQGAPANSAAPAQGSPAAAQPPTPTAAGPVMLGDRSMTRLDRRAGA